MRNTKQKELIYSIVNNSTDHMDAYHIYDLCRKMMPNISLGTVYRNLTNLVNEDKIIRFNINGFDRYDKRINHFHFVCSECGAIYDVFDNLVMEKEFIDGNMVIDYELKINGICKKCIERKEK